MLDKCFYRHAAKLSQHLQALVQVSGEIQYGDFIFG